MEISEGDRYVYLTPKDYGDPTKFVNAVIKEGESFKLSDAEILGAKGKPAYGSRNCKVSWISNSDMCQQVGKLFKPLNDVFKYDIRIVEHLQYTVYTEGHFFNWHVDARPPIEGTIRKFSMSMFLNDPEEYSGGVFELELGGPNQYSEIKTFKGNTGDILFFHSECYHRVLPVTSGTRKSLTMFIHGPKFL